MTLIQLQYFQALAYALHYTLASELLHISQPSLSYSVAELEKELGVPLFGKEGRKISLTKYGEKFLPYAEKALELLKEGEEQLRLMAKTEPFVVNLGYFYSISATLVPSLVEQYYRKKPGNVRFHFTQDLSFNIARGLIDGSLDLAFTLHPDEQYESVPIMTQPLFLVVPESHPLAAREEITVDDFAREPQIMLDKNANLRNRLEHIFQQRGLVPNVTFEVKECSAALQFVALNLGLAVLPRVPSVEAMPVRLIPIREKDFVRTVCFSWPLNRRLSPPVAEVRDFAVGIYGGQIR